MATSIHLKFINQSRFLQKVKSTIPKGETLNQCLTCGACSSACPATGLENMDPRKFLRMAALGFDQDLTEHPWVWMCSMCFRCTSVCPMEINIAGLVFEARKLWPREKRPKGIRESCDMALRTASASSTGTPPDDFVFVVEDTLEEVKEYQIGWDDMDAPIDKQNARFFLSVRTLESPFHFRMRWSRCGKYSIWRERTGHTGAPPGRVRITVCFWRMTKTGNP